MNLSRFARYRKARFLAVLLIVPALFLRTSIHEGSLRLGIALVVLGELIRLWANGYVGSVKVNQTQQWRRDARVGMLVTGGPYAFVRNPLYFGSFVMTAGLCTIVGQPVLAAVALTVFLAVYSGKIQEEERTLSEECREAFERYSASVPRLFPRFRRYAHRSGRWSMAGIWASREWKTCAWVTVTVILLYFHEEIVQEHESLLGQHATQRMILVAIAVALVAFDAGMEFVRRRRPAQPS